MNKTRAVLLLNCSYMPIQTITRRKAIDLLMREKAEAFNDNLEIIHYRNVTFKDFPKVLRLTKYSGVPTTIKLSKKNVLKRDGYRCAYCGNVFTQKELTVDHIIPKSRGGKFKWENLVCSCVRDNNKKGNKTPEEAHMKLLFEPRIPQKMEIMKDIISNSGEYEEVWSKFIG